jgi:hypothetical protein
MSGGVGVRVVCDRRDGPMAAAAIAALRGAGVAAGCVDAELDSPEGAIVLLDDASLRPAVARLIHLLPGRATLPNVVLVVDAPEGAGGLLSEGFRDVVAPGDLPAAIDSLLRGGPPVFMTRLRREVASDFLPAFAAELRGRAREKQAAVRDCIDLVRASAFLEKRLHRMRRLYHAQAIDDLLVQEGHIESYLAALDERSGARLGRLPAFPATPPGGVLGRREPRHRRAREELADAIDWLRQAGLLPAFGSAGLDALARAAETLNGKPLQGLRELCAIAEREIALRLALAERLQAQANPLAALEERCLERHGFGVLPPGIALPGSVHRIVRTLIQPPAEIYHVWCLDLRDLALKPCAEVLPEIARDLAWTREPRRPAPASPAARRAPAPITTNRVTGDRELS